MMNIIKVRLNLNNTNIKSIYLMTFNEYNLSTEKHQHHFISGRNIWKASIYWEIIHGSLNQETTIDIRDPGRLLSIFWAVAPKELMSCGPTRKILFLIPSSFSHRRLIKPPLNHLSNLPTPFKGSLDPLLSLLDATLGFSDPPLNSLGLFLLPSKQLLQLQQYHCIYKQKSWNWLPSSFFLCTH